MGATIIATDLTYAYGDQVAVGGISVEVAPGEVLGFLGPNGAGKSTTIKMLTGQLTPRSGTIEVLGMPMPAERTAIQQRIGNDRKKAHAFLIELLDRFFDVFPEVDGIIFRIGESDGHGVSDALRSELYLRSAKMGNHFLH